MLTEIDMCPDCKSTYFYTRTRTSTRVCRRCGRSWPIKRKTNGKTDKKNL